MLHFGIRRTVLCSRWSRTDRRTPTFRTRRLSDRPLRVLSDVGGCGFSDCDVVGAVALLWSNNLKLSANHRHLTQSAEIEYTDGRKKEKGLTGLRPSAPFVACGHKKGNGLSPVGFSIIALPGSQAFHYGASPLYPIPDPRMACGQIDVYGGRGGGALPRPAPFHLL